MFKQLFPTLLIPMLLLGAGCAQIDQTPEDVVTDTSAQDEQIEVMMFTDGTYVLASDESSVRWDGAKAVGSAHYGMVTVSEGALMVENGSVTGGSMVADMNSITVDDLEPGRSNDGLVNHLKSDDFFGAATYPTATLAIASVSSLEGIEGATHRVDGTMTIKGIENEVSFPAMIEEMDGMIQMTGIATLDRAKWEVKFGSGSFFEGLGDNLINDEFTLTFDLSFSAAAAE